MQTTTELDYFPFFSLETGVSKLKDGSHLGDASPILWECETSQKIKFNVIQ